MVTFLTDVRVSASSEVPLKDIIDVVLKAKVAAISFEGSNPRHEHEWRVWKEVKLGGKP